MITWRWPCVDGGFIGPMVSLEICSAGRFVWTVDSGIDLRLILPEWHAAHVIVSALVMLMADNAGYIPVVAILISVEIAA